jgi:site-specific recombinase XerD
MSELVPTAADIALDTATPPLLALEPGRAATGDPYRTYLDSLDSDTSRSTMRGCLDHIARMVVAEETGTPLPQGAKITGACRTWWRLRYEHTSRIRAELVAREDWSYNTVNKHLNALRRILKECWRLNLMTAEEYHRAADVQSVGGSREKTGRNINDDELARMLKVCEQTDGPAGRRDTALLGVLYCTGIRRAEAAAALIERYNPGERALRIIGKRNKERTVYIVQDVVPLLDSWLTPLGRKGAMFRQVDRWGNVRDEGMSSTAIGAIVKRVRQKAGLPPLSTHDFRRNYIGELLDAGVDLAQAQQLAGHASPITTATYDRRPEEALRDAADRITLPSPHNPMKGTGL